MDQEMEDLEERLTGQSRDVPQHVQNRRLQQAQIQGRMRKGGQAVMGITGGSFLLDEDGRPQIDSSKYQSTKVPRDGDGGDDRSVDKYRSRRISVKSRGSIGSGGAGFRGTHGSSGFGNLS